MKASIIAAVLLASVLPFAAAGPTVEELETRVLNLEKSVEELAKALAFLAEEPGMKATEPAKADDARPAKDEIIIHVRGNGEIVIAGKVLTLEGLDEFLKQQVDPETKPSARIRGDASVEYQRIVEVIEVCQKSGLWDISFGTQRKGAAKPADAKVD
jgi:biopolymer transport protein ExbD